MMIRWQMDFFGWWVDSLAFAAVVTAHFALGHDIEGTLRDAFQKPFTVTLSAFRLVTLQGTVFGFSSGCALMWLWQRWCGRRSPATRVLEDQLNLVRLRLKVESAQVAHFGNKRGTGKTFDDLYRESDPRGPRYRDWVFRFPFAGQN